MPGSSDRLHLAVALDGTGWHPASWREPDARPADLLTAGYWTDLVAEAERGLLDFVTLEDGFALQSEHPLRVDDRTDRVRGRLDATLIAARVAPRTRSVRSSARSGCSDCNAKPSSTVTKSSRPRSASATRSLQYPAVSRSAGRASGSRQDAGCHPVPSSATAR